jgi:type II secretory pathway pseudopilin PulG
MKQLIKRSGFTLIEVLVFISVGSIIFFLAIQLIHLSMLISRTANEQREHDAVLSRLARNFRRDMHHATAIELVSATQLLTDTGRGQSVIWELDDQRVRRSSQLGQQPSIEDYRLGDHYQVKIEHEPANKLIRLRVSRKSEVAEPMSRVERLVECHISSDVRPAGKQASNSTDSTEAQP